jgi:MscS family membrane protein
MSDIFDGRFGWLLQLFSLGLGAYLLSVILKGVFSYMDHKILRPESLLKHSLKNAALLPLQTLVWIVALILALNLFSFHFFGFFLIAGASTLIKMAFTLAAGWFLLQFKHQVFKARRAKNEWLKGLDHNKKDILEKVLSLFIYLLIIFTLLEQTGTSMNTLIAFGGISGLAIAFASQQLIANFFGGLMIYLTQPFRIGEQIILPEKGIEGDIEEIGWYATCVRGLDKKPLYIPNSMLNQVLIINNSRMSHRQFKHTLSFRYEDIHKVAGFTKDLKSFLFAHEKVDADYLPQVFLSDFGHVGLDVFVSASLKDTDKFAFQEATQELLLEINALAETHAMQLAIPVQSLHFPEGIKITT